MSFRFHNSLVFLYRQHKMVFSVAPLDQLITTVGQCCSGLPLVTSEVPTYCLAIDINTRVQHSSSYTNVKFSPLWLCRI